VDSRLEHSLSPVETYGPSPTLTLYGCMTTSARLPSRFSPFVHGVTTSHFDLLLSIPHAQHIAHSIPSNQRYQACAVMENPIPPILPEGFFRTTEEVYEEVANYPIVPPEKLYEYWQGIHGSWRHRSTRAVLG